MIWILMVTAGGYSHYSGVSIDMSQRFAKETSCIEMRDSIRRIDSGRKELGNSPEARQRLSAECVSRDQLVPAHRGQ